MTRNTAVEGVDPVAEVEVPNLPPRARAIHPGLVLRVRGRFVRLRGLRRQPSGVLRWLAVLGPGLVAGAVSNDAGSIATYSQAGAQFGYQLLWVIVLITVSLAVIQEMSARLGAATGRGLLDLIRERFGIGWALLAVVVVMVANFGLVLGEFVGIGAGMALFGVSKFVAVPVAAGLIWFLVTAGNYDRVERIFILMAALFLTYPVAAVLAHPKLPDVLRGAFVPTLYLDPAYTALLVALIGTTISPYQQVFQQSAVVERGSARHHYGPERWDTYAGMVFSGLISMFVVIATAATLHVSGITRLSSAADAAKALKPVLGAAAGFLFGTGLVGASLMAAAILPISTAFSVSEAFGLPKGLGLSLRRAPVFFGLFSVILFLGAGLSLIPGIPVFRFLLWVQMLNGLLLPVILVFMLLLINDRRLMGELRNNRLTNVLGWTSCVLIVVSVVFVLLQQLTALLGIAFL